MPFIFERHKTAQIVVLMCYPQMVLERTYYSSLMSDVSHKCCTKLHHQQFNLISAFRISRCTQQEILYDPTFCLLVKGDFHSLFLVPE